MEKAGRQAAGLRAKTAPVHGWVRSLQLQHSTHKIQILCRTQSTGFVALEHPRTRVRGHSSQCTQSCSVSGGVAIKRVSATIGFSE
jgi:hypothetical protein